MISSRISLLLPLGSRLLLYPKRLSIVNRSIPATGKSGRIPNYGQMREYKNFGHKPEGELPFYVKLYLFCIGFGITGLMIDWRWCRMIYLYYTGQLKEVEEVKEKYEIQEVPPDL